MIISIPLYIEEKPDPGRRPVFVVRPLFSTQPARQAELLGRAVTRVTQDLRMLLAELGRKPRHDELARWAWAPDLTGHLLDLQLKLKREHVKMRLLVATYPWEDRLVAFSPAVPGLYFEVPRTASVAARAEEVYTAHFRALLRGEIGEISLPGLQGRAWLSWAELAVTPERTAKSATDERKIAVAQLNKLSGELELMRTGTCLTWEDPDALPGATGRDAEVEALGQLLAQRVRRPVLLLGPRQVGKSALVQEHVRRSAELPVSGPGARKAVWHLSPQRLIAGMSYVGQWEQRLLAILDTAERKDLVLYFDDVLGLYAAGVSSVSELSVAHVLRARVEERRVRVVAEMTPEAFRLLKEKDRGFADLFHVLPVRETSAPETLRIAIALVRELEGRHRCRFELDALPAVLDVAARHARDLAFPGKAATFLRELAVKFAGAVIPRAGVLAEFSARTGLALSFLDGRTVTRRAEVRDALAARVIGQTAAVDAMADAVTVARARMADPSRPLASLLFLGPTGVGKTECARALARYLFGDPTRMLRFDMNEFIAPGSAARLVGTFAEPEGLLTAAVRRQPFAIVLLDEIEKAHPEVLDLLLQVLGDGRLTDGRGRTTDFAHTFIVMTSNLGAREAGGAVGFGDGMREPGQVYRRAAERFFRPELYNRFDRVVPFAPLSREHVETIARAMIDGVLERGGLKQRRCQLTVERSAMERIVDAGFHPELGARALRRAVETKLAQEVAERLAELPASAPALMRVLPAGAGITVITDSLVVSEGTSRKPLRGRPGELLERFEARLAELEPELAMLEPPEAVEAGKIRPEHLRYFAVRDQALRAAGLREHLARRVAARSPQSSGRGAPRRMVRRVSGAEASAWRALLSSEDPRAALNALASTAPRHGDTVVDRLEDLAAEVALLARMVASARSGVGTRATIEVVGVGPSAEPMATALAAQYHRVFADWAGFALRDDPPPAAGHISMTLEGPAAASLALREQGTHFFLLPRGGTSMVQVICDGDRTLRPVIRFHDCGGLTGDVDTGLLHPHPMEPDDVRALLTAGLFRGEVE